MRESLPCPQWQELLCCQGCLLTFWMCSPTSDAAGTPKMRAASSDTFLILQLESSSTVPSK